jgi:hypothetical protein
MSESSVDRYFIKSVPEWMKIVVDTLKSRGIQIDEEEWGNAYIRYNFYNPVNKQSASIRYNKNQYGISRIQMLMDIEKLEKLGNFKANVITYAHTDAPNIPYGRSDWEVEIEKLPQESKEEKKEKKKEKKKALLINIDSSSYWIDALIDILGKRGIESEEDEKDENLIHFINPITQETVEISQNEDDTISLEDLKRDIISLAKIGIDARLNNNKDGKLQVLIVE